jgi:hypothetical protein
MSQFLFFCFHPNFSNDSSVQLFSQLLKTENSLLDTFIYQCLLCSNVPFATISFIGQLAENPDISQIPSFFRLIQALFNKQVRTFFPESSTQNFIHQSDTIFSFTVYSKSYFPFLSHQYDSILEFSKIFIIPYFDHSQIYHLFKSKCFLDNDTNMIILQQIMITQKELHPSCFEILMSQSLKRLSNLPILIFNRVFDFLIKVSENQLFLSSVVHSLRHLFQLSCPEQSQINSVLEILKISSASSYPYSIIQS